VRLDRRKECRAFVHSCGALQYMSHFGARQSERDWVLYAERRISTTRAGMVHTVLCLSERIDTPIIGGVGTPPPRVATMAGCEQFVLSLEKSTTLTFSRPQVLLNTAQAFRNLRSVQAVSRPFSCTYVSRLTPSRMVQLGNACAGIIESIVESAPPHPGPSSVDSGQTSLNFTDDTFNQSGSILDVDRYW
jgi:hypothetical protein